MKKALMILTDFEIRDSSGYAESRFHARVATVPRVGELVEYQPPWGHSPASLTGVVKGVRHLVSSRRWTWNWQEWREPKVMIILQPSSR